MIGKLIRKYLNGNTINKFFDKLAGLNPKMLFAGGVVGVGSTIFAWYKKSPTIQYILEDIDFDLEMYRNDSPDGDIRGAVEVIKPHVKSLLKVAAVPVLMTLITIGMFTASNQIMAKRMATITGAYTVMSQEYVDYREAIKDMYGSDVDKSAYQRTQYKSVEPAKLQAGEKAYMIDDQMVVRKTDGSLTSVMVMDLYSGIEPEQATFDFGYKYELLNVQFKDQGYLLVNQVRDAFGVPRTPEGHYLGWSWGDNFELDWTMMPPANEMTGELLYDPDVYFVCDYELSWSVPTDITDEIRLGKIQA